MKEIVCSQCGYLGDNSPYRRLWNFDNKLLCGGCATKNYGYEEALNRLSQREGFTCDFCKEKRVIGFNTPLSNKIIGEKSKCGVCYYGSKSVECCELLSLFASHAQKNIVGEQEKKWFNDFTYRLFEALRSKSKLCDECLKFLEEKEES